MRICLFSAAIVSLLGLTAGLPTEPNDDLDRIPVSNMSEGQILRYNKRQADTAALYPRLIHGSQFSRRFEFLSLFKKPKPGVSYSAIRDEGGCKTADEIAKDVAKFTKSYSFIRLYSADCDQVKNTLAAAKKHDMQLFLGTRPKFPVADEIKMIADQVKGDWSMVDTVAIGNEYMLELKLDPKNKASAGQILAKLAEGREALKKAGYHPDKVKHAKVVLNEVWWHALENPSLCDDSDYCTVNFHPYFDENHGTEKAGQFMLDMVKKMRDTFKKNKRIHITETGWPTRDGDADRNPASPLHGRASVANQKRVLKDIKEKLGGKPGELILMSPNNDKWKAAGAPDDHVEKNWGIVE
ncbi:hypothetical protein MCOR25_004725 [Pyricularia grisea]|uniref:Glycoside hydrolase family 17 protein n=1 Tax=Pyricularia grisea TaxID=148305 RepID=A0A6P8AUI3_PYRGI|nr:uncharacterized protein PgNI_08415 [Pyricularia grisea]KAI6368042.1 hypothetical protein MCOR25_004725 [Pyricularia grisea]TLD05872.1 hypothetical protein PgNI_08415 [Pyricularia grisea]